MELAKVMIIAAGCYICVLLTGCGLKVDTYYYGKTELNDRNKSADFVDDGMSFKQLGAGQPREKY